VVINTVTIVTERDGIHLFKQTLRSFTAVAFLNLAACFSQFKIQDTA
jgi:hypothetical protein